ncbi:MAG: redoxin family protein [Leptolyngbyaceae cyanobacterium SM2_5_2]|nr:redoxin family protein [Leptolyngbyaceae cyanobacterium SM2_5_2]
MLSNSSLEGRFIPDVMFCLWTNGCCQPTKSKDFFAQKTIIVFGIPGAFAPLYSSLQLLDFHHYVELFKRHGVDDIACISVNDPFVMQEWIDQENIHNLTIIPDGDGEFSRQLGMLVDRRHQGMGERSRRYSMLVVNGIIDKVFPEPADVDDSLTVADAKTMLAYLNPQAELLPEATLLVHLWKTLLEPQTTLSGSLNY